MHLRWDTRYDMQGRRRKKKAPKGEVFKKYSPKPDFSSSVSPRPFRRDEGVHYKSAEDVSFVAAKPEQKQYTGDKRLVGLATLHKSNIVPVFEEEGGSDKQYAKDLAAMRRN